MKYEYEIHEAKKVRLNSYSPYSNFQVGACLKCKDGSIYTGCNVENDGIQSICAERVAFTKAISEGKREFDYIVVVGAPRGQEANEKCVPCGYCRQFISEFVDENFKVIVINNGEVIEYKITDLLPNSFKF